MYIYILCKYIHMNRKEGSKVWINLKVVRKRAQEFVLMFMLHVMLWRADTEPEEGVGLTHEDDAMGCGAGSPGIYIPALKGSLADIRDGICTFW